MDPFMQAFIGLSVIGLVVAAVVIPWLHYEGKKLDREQKHPAE